MVHNAQGQFHNVCTTNFKKIAHLTFKIKYLFSSNKVLKGNWAVMIKKIQYMVQWFMHTNMYYTNSSMCI